MVVHGVVSKDLVPESYIILYSIITMSPYGFHNVIMVLYLISPWSCIPYGFHNLISSYRISFRPLRDSMEGGPLESMFLSAGVSSATPKTRHTEFHYVQCLPESENPSKVSTRLDWIDPLVIPSQSRCNHDFHL